MTDDQDLSVYQFLTSLSSNSYVATNTSQWLATIFANKTVAPWQHATKLYLDGKYVSQIQLNGYLFISLGEIIECTSHL